VQIIGFLEGLPLDQLPPPVQVQVSEVLQALPTLMNPLLQQHITTCLQRIETLRQKFSASPRTERGTQEAE
jgi:DNA-binding FrmR family transcriptional regulator